jgi:5-methylcytosine-specific restriction endonuclease McrA
MDQPKHTPAVFHCKRCGWQGEVNGRPRCLPCYAANTARWRAENPEKATTLKRAMDKKARTERPEEYNAKRRRYRKPETNSASYRLRLNWLRSGDVTKDQLERIYIEANGRCHYCHSEVVPRFTPSDPRGFDHITPRSKGGRHTSANLVVCCRGCNERKSDRTEISLAQTTGGN